MNIAIVGAEAAKFTPLGEARARGLIESIILDAWDRSPNKDITIVSGECHLGGIDIWAKEAALGIRFPGVPDYRIGYLPFPPKVQSWYNGYRPRNIRIAKAADELHNITVNILPPEYTGMTFEYCYHCLKRGAEAYNHVKSGGCWTMWHAKDLGKPVHHHIVENNA